MKPPFIRTEFNYDMFKASDESAAPHDPVSLTIQSQADEADINTIVRRFGLTGQVPQGVRVPLMQDFDEVFDYQSAMNAVISAEASFKAMPASIRSKFHNSPQEFLAFCDLPENLEEMRKLGLAVPLPEVSPPPVSPPG